MSNVISIGLPRRPNLGQRQASLMRSFALCRRQGDDVFWLKENAELLNVLATGHARIAPADLETYRPFYDSAEERLRFFPQYYRFILSICLDLEDLGLAGGTGERLCARAAALGLAEAELSDLQRAEAQRLLARRGQGGLAPELVARLHDFIGQTRTFALPNKKAAYELTHIVFYLSDYGARPLALSREALVSLEYAGLLAFLDADVDLLAEICVALRFAGRAPSGVWEDWIAREMACFVLDAAAVGPRQDAYHEYLVTSWWAGFAGRESFPGRPGGRGLAIRRARAETGPLRAISEHLYRLGPARSGDWPSMKQVLNRALDRGHLAALEEAARSSQNFDDFFRGFARAQ